MEFDGVDCGSIELKIKEMDGAEKSEKMQYRPKRAQKLRTPKEKADAVKLIRGGASKAAVSRQLGIPESTLRGWVKAAVAAQNMEVVDTMPEMEATTRSEEDGRFACEQPIMEEMEDSGFFSNTRNFIEEAAEAMGLLDWLLYEKRKMRQQPMS